MWNIESTEQNIALWTEELAAYTVSDLRRSFKTIIHAGGKSPPTLPEIIKLCSGTQQDAQNRAGPPIDVPGIEAPKMTKKQAAENRARLKRIMAGLELDIAKHCTIGHLSNPLKERFRESCEGYPTYRGHAIHPKYIRNTSDRDDYIEEIKQWREANAGA